MPKKSLPARISDEHREGFLVFVSVQGNAMQLSLYTNHFRFIFYRLAHCIIKFSIGWQLCHKTSWNDRFHCIGVADMSGFTFIDLFCGAGGFSLGFIELDLHVF